MFLNTFHREHILIKLKIQNYCEKLGLKTYQLEFNISLDARKSVWGANNKGADQPEYLRRMISAFVILFLEISCLNLLQVKFQFSN